jgi:hypothetical protein
MTWIYFRLRPIGVRVCGADPHHGKGKGKDAAAEEEPLTMAFVPLRDALHATWSAMGDGREG